MLELALRVSFENFKTFYTFMAKFLEIVYSDKNIKENND